MEIEAEYVSLFKSIISDFTTFGKSRILEINETNRVINNRFCSNYNFQLGSFREKISNLTVEFLNFQNYYEKQNNKSSCHLNIFTLFNVGEKMHSVILANFLNPHAGHGQKHLFLNVFLDLLKIERYSDNENWIVTAEKGRIDVLLKRNDPHSVIVIENKSNFANDQENQLYRYWHQEIYNTICSRYLPIDYILNPPEVYYQLIYLTPTNLKIPSNNSLKKPSDFPNELPDEVPLKTKHLIFNYFIVNWLTLSLDKIPIENHRIREHIKQYLEFWTYN